MSSYLILLRHAERPSIAPGTMGNEVLLTDKGKQDAGLFAKTINAPLVSVLSSPIMRCVETAKIIAANTNYPEEDVAFDYDLGAPGYIIKDLDKAWASWREKGDEAITQFLLSGAELWDGFADLNQATIQFTKRIHETLSARPSGIHVWVTHDIILAAFASRVLPRPLEVVDWPGFLGYLKVTLNKNQLAFHYEQMPIIG